MEIEITISSGSTVLKLIFVEKGELIIWEKICLGC